MVLAINSCHNTTCIPPADLLGSILYNGPFSPKFDSPPTSLPPAPELHGDDPRDAPQRPRAAGFVPCLVDRREPALSLLGIAY